MRSIAWARPAPHSNTARSHGFAGPGIDSAPARNIPGTAQAPMLFNSLTFVVFFAVVLALFRLLPSWPAKKVLLLIASYVFYGAWNPPFVLLLLFSTFIDYWAAQRMARAES